VIIEFDGRDINSPEELIVAVRSKDVGDVVKLTYIRKGQRATVMLTLTAGK
jgi:putative serine protease PepD